MSRNRISSSERRYFENTFEDYDGRTILQSDNGKIVEPHYSSFKEKTVKLLKQCEEGVKRSRDDHDYSVYTGSSGMALLYLHLSETLFEDDETQKQQCLMNALTILEGNQRMLRGKRMTFLCGDSGILSLLSVLYSKLGQEEKSIKYLSRLLTLSDSVCGGDDSLPDEVLYGRAGYLFSLLFVQKHLGDGKIDKDILNKICQSIIVSGERLARQERSRVPLMYMWHEKHYVGAAHGIVGIIYMLLQALSTQSVQSNLRNVESCVEFILSEQFSSGNFPSSLESGIDKLIHWCHGAPGAVHLMVKAYQIDEGGTEVPKKEGFKILDSKGKDLKEVEILDFCEELSSKLMVNPLTPVFGKEKYLNAAIKCGEVVWNRGILKKGYGICHGVAGNAYSFLSLYKQTSDAKYLHRAMKFAEWCFDYGQHGCRIPDRPFSLFEGMAGTLYFLADMLQPKMSKFPAFEL